MQEYLQMINEMLDLPLIKRGDYYDYKDSINREEFNSAFLFYKETLQNNVDYGIVSNFLFFNNYTTVNAKAAKHNENYIISINMGTILFLIQSFKSHSLSDFSLEYWGEFEEGLHSSIPNLMYENALHFTFYHEMAHLIQKSKFLEDGIYEQYSETAFSAEKHVLELDADEYSAVSMSAHLLQYSRDLFGDGADSSEIEKIFIIACASILIYILRSGLDTPNIYYKETDHPHPIIRVSRIIYAMINYCNEAMGRIGMKALLNPGIVIRKTIEMGKPIYLKIFQKDYLERYTEQLMSEEENIKSYLKEMGKLAESDTTLAIDKWNILAIKLHGTK